LLLLGKPLDNMLSACILSKEESEQTIEFLISKPLSRNEIVSAKKCEWIICPVCGQKTRLKVWEDTELKNFPLFCPKCKQKTAALIFIFQSRRITAFYL